MDSINKELFQLKNKIIHFIAVNDLSSTQNKLLNTIIEKVYELGYTQGYECSYKAKDYNRQFDVDFSFLVHEKEDIK